MNYKLALFFLLFSCIMLGQKSVFDIARSGTIEEIKEIHTKFSDTINSKNESGFTPLVLACYRKNNDVGVYLAENVLDVNGNSQYGTPLMAAVVKENITMVKKLLELKADPNIGDANKTTALHYAIMFQFQDIVELLVKNGAKKNLEDSKGFTAKDYALKYNNQHINKLLKI